MKAGPVKLVADVRPVAGLDSSYCFVNFKPAESHRHPGVTSIKFSFHLPNPLSEENSSQVTTAKVEEYSTSDEERIKSSMNFYR